MATPNRIGYFRFTDLEVGTYLIRLESRNFQFMPNDVVISLADDATDLEFTATPLH